VRKVFHKIHLLLGLTSGIIVFILAVTGCIYAFEREIQDAVQDYRFVEPQSTAFIAPSRVKAIADSTLPGKIVHSVIYGDKADAATIVYYSAEPEYYYLVYINPYTGKVLHVKDMDSDFFRFILDGHFYLWMPPEVGQPVVASATLVFVVMLITGIILWFPKRKEAARQRFTIKWKSKWRRKNFDLHSVLGFYASFIALVFAITGLVWGFEWFANSYYAAWSRGKEMVPYYEAQGDTTASPVSKNVPLIDFVWQQTNAENPLAEMVEVHFPETNSAAIHVATNTDDKTYWQTDNRFYDQNTLKEISVTHQYGRFSEATPLADKVMRMNYDIHTGAVLGFTGKVIAFCISLIIATLPVTGFLLWYGRKFKKAKVRVAEAPVLVREEVLVH
jgi:uncharacterized iron-regulated membrane protein